MKRECGDCHACCKLLPVKGINKPALTRCQHQRHHKGCAVYHRPEKGFPWECGLWSCVWLTGNDAAKLSRPDRAHYCIDIMPDYITADQPNGVDIRIPVVQIWADPKYPDCHRDPELRAWLLRRRGFAGLVRYGNDSTVILIPPYMIDTHEWTEKRSSLHNEGGHKFADILETLGTMR